MEVNITPTTLAVFVVLLILFLIGLLVYLYPASGKASSIPGPHPSDVEDGNISDLRKAGSVQEYLQQLHDEYGKIVGFWYGNKQIVSVADLECFAPRSQIFEIPDVLFEGWRPLIGDTSFIFSQGLDVFSRRERLDFHVDTKTKQYFGTIFSDMSQELVKKWKSTPDGQHVPLTLHLRALATKAVCRMLFGDYFKNDSHVIKLHRAWEHCWTYIESLALEEDSVNLEKDFRQNLKVLEKVLEEAMDDNFKKRGKGNVVIFDEVLSSSKTANESQLLADAITQLTIGMHITHSVLLWTVYFVAAHSKVQEKLRKQLSKTEDSSIMPDSLAKISYVQNILKESVRCGSVFSWTARKQDIDVTLGSNIVSKNTPVIEAIGEALTDEKQFADPCLYNPERFAKAESMNPLKFIPFAFGGSRKAPEDSIVYLLVAILICNVVRELKIQIAGDVDVAQDLHDPGYCSFVSKPSKEELWAVVSPVGKTENLGKKE